MDRVDEAQYRAADVARRYREAEAALMWRDRVRVGAASVLALAAFLVALYAVGDCGNIGDAHADPDPEPAVAPHPAASRAIPVDPAAFALAARLQAWQPTWRALHAGELEAVAIAIVDACRGNPYPTAERCPALLSALVFRESGFRADAIGARGEIGLAQLHGLALAGETREAAADPATNLRLALAWLKRSAYMCRLAGHDSVEAALSAYGTGRCRSYRGARLLLRYEEQLRAGGAP